MASERPDRASLLGIIGGLMLSENLGDAYDEINLLCDLAGVPRREGAFGEWTDEDWASIRQPSPDREEG